ncbi:MAG: hypothetical protein DRJ18_01610 [Candidatus Methanomethylicota archaeon]|nr:MAG: hypothetical protein DRJ18_01610 [Candidatus Verstraetearchaeota archaeon]
MLIKAHRMIKYIKPKLLLKIIRNGKTIFKYKRKRDLLVYDGQLAIAYLISRGAVGIETGNWLAVASENTSSPNMADSSGDPLNNEFNPVIGSPVSVTWSFQPTVRPSAYYQTQAEIIIEGTVVSDRYATFRKMGIIDDFSPPNQHIIFEDAVIPKNVEPNDNIYIRYTIPI